MLTWEIAPFQRMRIMYHDLGTRKNLGGCIRKKCVQVGLIDATNTVHIRDCSSYDRVHWPLILLSEMCKISFGLNVVLFKVVSNVKYWHLNITVVVI